MVHALRTSLRYASVLLVSSVVAALFFPVAASAAVDYRYWFASAQTKVLPTTAVPVSASGASDALAAVLGLSAARAEFEGRQIAIHPTGALSDLWLQPSDLSFTDAGGTTHVIPASNVTAYKVEYIRIRTASYGYHRTGLEPDPLIPMTLANGQRLGWLPAQSPDLTLRGVAAGQTQPFYLLFHVPDDAVAGTYSGTVRLTAADAAGAPAPTVTLPVALTVYPFSVAQKTLRTAFGFDLAPVKTNTAHRTWLSWLLDPPLTRVPESTDYQGDQYVGWMRYLSEHRISPSYMPPTFAKRAANGTMSARSDVLADYLGTGAATTFTGQRFAFDSVKLPNDSMTSYLNNPFADPTSTRLAANYYRSVASQAGSDVSKLYAYPVDEPLAAKMPFVRRYAAFVHKVAPAVKFLLTLDAKSSAGKLAPGVDIYVYRLQNAFRDSTFTSKVRAAHKALWTYVAKSVNQRYVPGYLLDEALAGSRVQGWFSFRLRASGLLYHGADRYYGMDPYVSQLTRVGSSDGRSGYANGDACLIYPGYYPRLGLVVEGAPPVGSLRMEALRDGLEDYEYVKQIAARYGVAAADRYVARIIGPTPRPVSGRAQVPSYKTSASDYESVRAAMAADLSR
jgi:hypothetical protein